MKKNRVIAALVGLVITGALLGAGVPSGVAQTSCTDPNYCPIEGGGGTAGTVAIGNTPAPVGSPARAYQLRRCKARARAKFGDNKVRLRAALKKCKKRYGS